MPRPSRPFSCARIPGFTLVELLVVLGIIGVLLAILLPALARARESSSRLKCLANTRSLAMATLTYLNDNRQTLPEAGSTNAPMESPLCPRTNMAPPGAPISGGRYVLAGVGALLERYLEGNRTQVWRCPSSTDDSFRISGDNPSTGVRAPDEFKPNYNYMAGKEVFYNATLGGPITRQFKLREWAARNIAGLTVGEIRSTGQSPSDVVVFHDRHSTYHSQDKANIYTATGEHAFFANYAYLDGHAGGRTYRNVDGYIGSLHEPIPQVWFGEDFTARLPEQYAR